MVDAVLGDGPPTAGRLAHHDSVFSAHEGQRGCVVDDGIDVSRSLQSASDIVRRIAAPIVLGPSAAAAAVASPQREYDDIAAPQKPLRRLLIATAELHPRPILRTRR